MTAALCAVFAVSGAAGLAFEVLWFHQAAIALGSSVSASSAVLAGYMTGLGAGSALAGRLGDRPADPVRTFALLELAVGVTGIALVLGLPALAGPLARATAPLAGSPALLAAGRWALACALLLVPTTAMGASLPLLVRSVSGGPQAYRSALGLLYGANTLGAVAGVVATELWLLGALGVRGSAAAAGTGNLLAAGAALALAPRHRPRPPAPAATPQRSDGTGAAWLAAAAGVGFATLALEVVGFRFLSLFVVTRASVFAWMLATVLAGIALGGLAGGRIARGRDGAAAAAPVALLAGASTAAAYAVFPWTAGTPGPAVLERGADVLRLSVALLGLPALLSGALFPLLGAGLRRRARSAAGATGALALANTAGAAAGALAARFALLPGLGMERSLFAVALLYAAVGVGIARPARPTRGALAAAAAAAALALGLFPFGALRERHLEAALATYADDDTHVVRVREGLDHTVVWLETRFLGAPYYERLVTDSFSMSATDVHARRYMKLFAWLPLAVHPHVRDALLVSYGVGSTAAALVASPDLAHLDVVDTSRAILDGQDVVFPDPAERPLADPRVDVHVEDGRYFLARTRRRYDLITGEPPPPVLAGVVHLYTREYFALARERLAPGGMLTYWLPLRVLSDTATRAVVRAFCDVFPDCSLWHGMGFELVLLGTNGATGPVPEARFRRAWQQPGVRDELAALGLERPEQLGATFVADAPELRAAVGPGPALTDDRPRLVTAPPTSPEAQGALYSRWFDPRRAHDRFATSGLVARLWPPALRRDSLPFFGLQHLLDTFTPGVRSGAWSERLDDLRAVLTGTGLRTPAQWLLGTDADLQAIVAGASPAALRRPEAQLQVGVGRLAARDYPGAASALERAQADPDRFADAAPLRVFALCMAGQRDEARRAARRIAPALGTGPRARDYWRWMADTFGVGPAAR